MTRALICGIGGQDGTFLAQFLLRKGYTVWGTSRDAQLATFDNLKTTGIFKDVTVISMAPTDFRSVILAFEASTPDEIYFLPGQSSVGLSFEQPAETLQSTVLGVLNALEAMRFLGRSIKFYNASSSECFGDLGRVPATETTPFHPRSPYAVARASGHWLVTNYRDAYGLHASNGILFNHESNLRPHRFVTQKIVSAARRINQGSKERLKLGRIDIVRDWGWAPEYVEAMWLMLQQEIPDDYVIATGEAHSLEEFVSYAFSLLGLSWKDHVDIDKSLYRPSDLMWSQGNPQKAALRIGWQARFHMHDVIKEMLNEA
jgi:GDPmannose 4,6-dehydratase